MSFQLIESVRFSWEWRLFLIVVEAISVLGKFRVLTERTFELVDLVVISFNVSRKVCSGLLLETVAAVDSPVGVPSTLRDNGISVGLAT